ncbi:SPOR domain-containing protein [bacterium]|nr:SPOR domain-containing protein [bacterium]
MDKLKRRKNILSLFYVLCAAFLCILSAACESPRVVKHPVSRGDTYYYYVTFYGDEYNGKNMANGEPFSNDAMTCAAKGFPFGTMLEVQSLDTGKKVEVTVIDRPGKEVVDLTKKAFDEIDNAAKGKIRAKIKVVGLAESAPKAASTAAAEPEKSAEEEKAAHGEEQKEPEKEAPKEARKEVFYAIMLAAFGNIDAAKNYQSGIKEDTYIFTSDGKFEVRYGRYSSKEEAQADINNFSWKDAEIVTIEE